jgi:DNA (cytosine-5)-methyltransferase 1
MWNAREHPDLVEPTRAALKATGRPYVIENVPGAPLVGSVTLCGTMFGLRTDEGHAELRRHRLFESDPFLFALLPPCHHNGAVIGVYGGHGRDRRRSVTVTGHAGGRSVRDGTQQFSTPARREAMGIDWMTGNELSQAIPPAYTEFIGKQLIRHLTAASKQGETR